MSNNMHKSELSDSLNATLSERDLLPLHPKNKLLLYNKHLLSKLSWHFTVANLSKTWVCEPGADPDVRQIRTGECQILWPKNCPL